MFDIVALPSGSLPSFLNGGPEVQKAPPQRFLGSNHRHTWRIFKSFFLQNHFPQMLEILYVALLTGP